MTRPRPLFISGRVRSGSTMLWNIYDRLPGYRAFYQPCHDNLLPHIRCTAPMESHRGVSDYWGSLRAIGEGLEHVHRPEFGITRLLLEADEAHDGLRDYIRFLIDQCSDDEVPVLQFNTACWRLPWLRRNFPEAHLIHLWRDPRDSWFSMVRHLPREIWNEPDLSDAYDLLQWASDLAPHFPFLFGPESDSSYARAYFMWKLSRVAGERCADTVLSYNDDIQDGTKATLARLVDRGVLAKKDVRPARRLIEETPRGQWREAHEDAGMALIESRCDATLAELGLLEHFGAVPLAEIRERYAEAWSRQDAGASAARALRSMLVAYSHARGEVTRLLHEVRIRDAASGA